MLAKVDTIRIVNGAVQGGGFGDWCGDRYADGARAVADCDGGSLDRVS